MGKDRAALSWQTGGDLLRHGKGNQLFVEAVLSLPGHRPTPVEMMSGRINGLDGIRALAVLCVYVQHSNEMAARFALGKVGVWAFSF